MSYSYDADVKGTLSSVTSGGNGATYTHDSFGRVTGSSQTTAGLAGPVPMSYAYSLTDQLTGMTYPSGRVVNYGLDSAGRVSSVATSSTNYASGVTYAPHGGLSSLLLGNGITQTYTYNDQFQQTGVSAGSLLSLSTYPCDSGQVSCAGNTGNIWRQTIAVGGSVQAVQEYRYDPLNRLSLAAERAGTAGFAPSCPDGGSVWCQSYTYDTAGNRTISQHSGDSATPRDAPGFSASTNRVSGSGWSYDNAGNTLANGSGESAAYDAENRMIAFCTQDPAGCPDQAGIGRTLYVYDGEGQRVLRQYADGTQTAYVYDAFGNLAAEYSTGAPAASGTQYVMGDHLDSTRLAMSGSAASERHDYLPFGQEYNAAAGTWRLGGGIQGYGTDTVRQKFTGQERDNETSLDFFQARYFSGAQGRFLSVDPGNAGSDPTDPQSWNGYAYVSNNPMVWTDPDGLGIFGDIGTFLGGFFGGWPLAIVGWIAGSDIDVASGGSISPFDFTGAFGINSSIGPKGPGGTNPNLGGLNGLIWGNQNPFILDYNPALHQNMTYSAAIAAGLSDVVARYFAFGVAGVDKGTQGRSPAMTHIHAMGGKLSGRYETCAEAYAGAKAELQADTQRALAGDDAAKFRALHVIQDSYSTAHQYQPWKIYNYSPGHYSADSTWSNAPVAATTAFLNGLQGKAPMGSPDSYLYRPSSCR